MVLTVIWRPLRTPAWRSMLAELVELSVVVAEAPLTAPPTPAAPYHGGIVHHHPRVGLDNDVLGNFIAHRSRHTALAEPRPGLPPQYSRY